MSVYEGNSSPGKARSHEAGAGTVSRPMSGANEGSIPSQGSIGQKEMTSLEAACDRIDKLEAALRRLQQLGSQVEILPDSDYVREFDAALRYARELLS